MDEDEGVRAVLVGDDLQKIWDATPGPGLGNGQYLKLPPAAPDLFADVGAFHERFGLPVAGGQAPHLMTDEVWAFRLGFMLEELTEMREAREAGDVAGFLDAVVDLAYVVIGTAHFAGLPFDEAWAEVQRANMAKVRGALDGSDSKRASRWDVIKPPGWAAPDHGPALARHAARAAGSADFEPKGD